MPKPSPSHTHSHTRMTCILYSRSIYQPPIHSLIRCVGRPIFRGTYRTRVPHSPVTTSRPDTSPADTPTLTPLTSPHTLLICVVFVCIVLLTIGSSCRYVARCVGGGMSERACSTKKLPKKLIGIPDDMCIIYIFNPPRQPVLRG